MSLDLQPTAATVFVVDDDEDVRRSLDWTFQTVGLAVRTFPGPAEILAGFDPAQPGCLVLDLRLPGMSGLDLRKRLAQQGSKHPFVMISGHGDIGAAVDCMRAGASDYLEKPCNRQRLVDAVQQAIEQDAKRRIARAEEQSAAQKLALLTDRERQVFDRIVAGQVTKEISSALGISPRTVDVHRSRIMQKLNVQSVSQLACLIALQLRASIP